MVLITRLATVCMRVPCQILLCCLTSAPLKGGRGRRGGAERGVEPLGLQERQGGRRIVDWQLSTFPLSTSTWSLATTETPTTTTSVPMYVCKLCPLPCVLSSPTGGPVLSSSHWVSAVLGNGPVFCRARLRPSRHALETAPHRPAVSRETPIEAHPSWSSPTTHDTSRDGHPIGTREKFKGITPSI